MDNHDLENMPIDANAAATPSDPQTSNLPESSPEIDIDAIDNSNPALERMNARGVRGRKICDISCLAGGILGTLGIGFCTAAACVLFSSVKQSSYAVEFPNGAVIGDVSSSVGDDGRPIYDVDISDGGNSGSDDGNSSSPSDNSQAGTGSSVPGDDIDNSDSSNSNSDPNSGGETSVPDDTGGGASNSGDTSDPGDEGNSPSGNSGETSQPSRPMPGTGEFSPERVTPLMESEILRSQAKRVSNGESRFLPSDIEISVPDHGDISRISSAYGFSEEFILEYNDIADASDAIFLFLPLL